MKRWAICRVGDFENEGTLVPKFNLYQCNSRIWTKPGFAWCIGQIAAPSLTEINADPDIYVLPDGAMDMMLSSIPSGTRTTMRNRLEAGGFVFTDVKNTWSVRQLLVYLAKQLQPALTTVEQGDVRDIES